MSAHLSRPAPLAALPACRTATVCCLLFAALSGTAQPDSATQFSARVGSGFYFAGQLKGEVASLKGDYYRFGAGFSHVHGSDWRFGMNVAYNRWNARWSDPVPFAGLLEKPFDQVEQTGFNANLNYRISQRYSLVGFGGVSWARASGSDSLASVALSDGRNAFGGVVLAWQANPRLSLSFGLLASSRLEDRSLLTPVLGLRYRHNDIWSLRLFEVSGIDNFDIIAFDYRPANVSPWLFSASLQWANQAFALGRSANSARVATSDRAYRILLGATYAANSGWFFQPFAGFDVYRKIQFRSQNASLDAFRVQNSWTAGANFGRRF